MVNPITHRPGPTIPWALLIAALLGIFGLPCGVAHAVDRPIRCAVDASREIRCDIDLRAAFTDPKIRERLRNGFPNTVLYRLYIRQSTDDEPVALTAQRNVAVFELWDEVFYVEKGNSGTRSSIRDETQMIQQLTAFPNVLAAQSLPPGVYYADLIVELNPLSAKEEAEIRSWIARSRGGHRTFSSGDRSFFGTFVSLFTNIRPGQAERIFRHQTPLFTVK